MSMRVTMEQLRGACAMFALEAGGSEAALRERLGSFLVDRLFSAPAAPSPSTSSDGEAQPSQRRREKRPLSAAAAAWHAFARRERELVKQSGVTDHVQVVKEVAARYKRFKLVGTSQQPPMLAAPDDKDDDGFVRALAELPEAEIADALAAHGLTPGADADANVAMLARALL